MRGEGHGLMLLSTQCRHHVREEMLNMHGLVVNFILMQNSDHRTSYLELITMANYIQQRSRLRSDLRNLNLFAHSYVELNLNPLLLSLPRRESLPD